MFIQASQNALFAPQLALASSNGVDRLSLHVGQYLNLAISLEAALDMDEPPREYIAAKRGLFTALERLDPFRNEYNTLKGIFDGTMTAEPSTMDAILRGVIRNIYQTAEKLISPEEYRRYVGEDPTPTPPTVTDEAPLSSHVSGPPTTPAEVNFERVSDYHALPQTVRMDFDADTTIRDLALALGSIEEEMDDSYDPEGVSSVPPLQEIGMQYSETALTALNDMAIAKRAEGDYDGAIKLCLEGIKQTEHSSNKNYYYMFCTTMGETLRLRGQGHALRFFESALEYYSKKSNQLMSAVVHRYLSMTYSDQRNWDEARKHGLAALRLANAENNPRMLAMAELSLAIACLGNEEVEEALEASTKSVGVLGHVTDMSEPAMKARITHARCLRKSGHIIAAAKLVDETHLALRRYTEQHFGDERRRRRFLDGIRTHVEIERAWMELRDYLGVDTDEQIRKVLAKLDVRPGEVQAEETRFIDPQVNLIEIKPSIVRPEYPWKDRIETDVIFGGTRAGAIVDRSLAEVVRSTVTKPIGVPKNKGGWPGISAMDIGLISMFDRNFDLYVHGSWKMHAIPGVKQMMHTAGVKDEYEHLLKGTITEKGHMLMIELAPAEMETIELTADKSLTVPFDKRPKPAQPGKPAEFGKLRFYFEPVDSNHTRVVFEFENARFTIHPEEFLRAVITNLALAG